MEGAGEVQGGTAAPVPTSVSGAASSPPPPGLCLSLQHSRSTQPGADGTSELTLFLVLPGLALPAHVEVLAQPL